jgi:ABC-type uncharacterized transport system YnjBCD permease subunit
MLWVVLAVGVVVLVLVVVAGHILLTWAERRGWIYYRSTGRPRARSLGLLEEIYQPSITHVIDQQVTEKTEADQAESGEEV